MLRSLRITAFAVLALCCTAFFRTENTQKSMIRALLLEQTEDGWQTALLYQAPEAAADSSEASAEVQIAAAEAETMEKAIALAERALPQTPNYRLCDYLLLCPDTGFAALNEYEALVLRRPVGRTAACVLGTDFPCAELLDAAEDGEDMLYRLLEQAEKSRGLAPRLYEQSGTIAFVLPQLTLRQGLPAPAEEGRLLTRAAELPLSPELTQAVWLLTGRPGERIFWLEEQECRVRRADLSVSLQETAYVTLRIDCQSAFGTPPLTKAQQAQLAALCEDAVRLLWGKGEDLLGLSAFGALQTGKRPPHAAGACPELRVEVYGGSFF